MPGEGGEPGLVSQGRLLSGLSSIASSPWTSRGLDLVPQSEVPGPAASASPGNSLEMDNLWNPSGPPNQHLHINEDWKAH